MTIVWLLNNPVSISSRLLYNVNSQSGAWIDATFDSLKTEIEDSSVKLHIIAPVKKEQSDIEYCYGCVCHYIKWHRNRIGEFSKKSDALRLKKLLESIKPDLIMAWGTEFSFNYTGIMCAKQLSIPSLIYIQGLANSFVGYENAHLSYKKMSQSLTLFEKLKLIHTKQYSRSLEKQTVLENRMFENCDGVISDNKWCFEIAKSVNPHISCYYSLLPISDYYTKTEKWSFDNMSKHHIFTIAGRTAYKGLHNLIEAIKIVKCEYPDVKLYIPGNMKYGKPKFLKKPPYLSYLEKIIKENNLSENICFVGKLSTEEMSVKMREAHCFVMPSCIENHSSTLREALCVGTPCISSMVGSICDLIENNSQALLYRYEDVYALSMMIKRIFKSDELCRVLSKNGKERIIEFYNNEEHLTISQIYSKVMENK